MGCRKGEKIMKIPAEFEDIFRGVELTEREALFLSWITSWDDYTIQNMRTVLEKVRSTLSTLQAENKELRDELERCKEKNAGLALALLTECAPNPDCLGNDEWRAIRAELEQVKRERDEAIKTIFQWVGCPECKHWNSTDEWCEKYDREADGCGGCDSPEWRGQKEG